MKTIFWFLCEFLLNLKLKDSYGNKIGLKNAYKLTKVLYEIKKQF